MTQNGVREEFRMRTTTCCSAHDASMSILGASKQRNSRPISVLSKPDLTYRRTFAKDVWSFGCFAPALAGHHVTVSLSRDTFGSLTWLTVRNKR